MTIDDTVKLVKAFTGFAAAVVWPAVALLAFVKIGPSLHDFFRSIGELSLKIGGGEVVAGRKQEAARNQRAAVRN